MGVGGLNSENCMHVYCVFAEQMTGWDIIYCVVYVRVKLNSWHWNIEALFQKKTGHLFDFFYC